MAIAEVIRTRRKEIGWTQAEAAGRAGLTRVAWCDIERGQVRRPKPDTLSRMAEALGLTLSEVQVPAEAPAPDTAAGAPSADAQRVARLWDRLTPTDQVRIIGEIAEAALSGPGRGFGPGHDPALAGAV